MTVLPAHCLLWRQHRESVASRHVVLGEAASLHDGSVDDLTIDNFALKGVFKLEVEGDVGPPCRFSVIDERGQKRIQSELFKPRGQERLAGPVARGRLQRVPRR